MNTKLNQFLHVCFSCMTSLLVICMFCSCVSLASEDTSLIKTSSDALYQNLLAIDFSSEILISSSFDEYGSTDETLSGFAKSYLRGMALSQGKGIPNRDLTAAERNRLGLWRFDDGSTTFWQMTFAEVRRYYACNCEIPASGLDLVPDLLTQTGYDEFTNMSRAEQLRKYRDIIDPITGHLYASFIAETWEPGAMYIQVITDPAVIEERYPHRKVGSLEYNQETGKFQDGPRKPVSEIWKIRIYGEEPGTVLYEGESCY